VVFVACAVGAALPPRLLV